MKTALITGGLNLLGRGFDAMLGNVSQQQQLENIRALRQEENVYNHPAAQRARMEQAGYSAFNGDISPGSASTTTNAPFNKAIENGLNLQNAGTNLMNAFSSVSNLMNDEMQRELMAKQIENLQADIVFKEANTFAVQLGYDKIAAEINNIISQRDKTSWETNRSKSFFDYELQKMAKELISINLQNAMSQKDIDNVDRFGFKLGTQQDNIFNFIRKSLPPTMESDVRNFITDWYKEAKRKFYRHKGKNNILGDLLAY